MKSYKNEEHTGTFFEQGWFLDIVAPGHWSRKIITSKNNVIGSYTYCKYSRFGINYIKMPKMTQHLGFWINDEGLGGYKKLSRFEKVVKESIGQLGDITYHSQRISPEFTNIQQLQWLGFKVDVKYTYVLNNIKEHKKILSGFESKVRTVINKNMKSCEIEIKSGLDVAEFYKLLNDTFNRQNIPNKFTQEMVECVVNSCRLNGCGEIFYAIDEEGEIHSAALIVWDEFSAYYLLSGSNIEFRNSNSLTLVLWEGIKQASKYVDVFDFEGSMIEPIARFVRGFGAEGVPYFHIQRFSSRILEMVYKLR